MRRYALGIGVVVLACTVSACDESLSSVAGPTPDLAPTFASIQSEIFEKTDSANRAACVNCHTNVNRPQGPAGGLVLLHDVAYDQIVNVASTQQPGLRRVQPGDPDVSYILHKVEGRGGITGRRMPFNPPYLTAGQIRILRRWIEIGAPRD